MNGGLKRTVARLIPCGPHIVPDDDGIKSLQAILVEEDVISSLAG